jgi:hypothetical protein
MSRTLKTLAIASLALLITACGPRNEHRHEGYHNQGGIPSMTQAGGQFQPGNRPKLRLACAAELQQYCANEPKRFKCLRENRAKLGGGCQAAFNQMLEFRRQRKLARMQNGATQSTTQQSPSQPGTTQPNGAQGKTAKPNGDDDDDQ